MPKIHAKLQSSPFHAFVILSVVPRYLIKSHQVSKIEAKQRDRPTISLTKHTACICWLDLWVPWLFEAFSHKMPESSFDIDRLGMLTLQHFEHSVESDSSCGENNYSSSELRSNASSPSYFSSGSESPVCSPTELNFPTQRDEFWDHKGGKEVAIPSGQQPTCRYRRGDDIDFSLYHYS